MVHSNITLDLANDLNLSANTHDLHPIYFLLLLTAIAIAMAWKSKPYITYLKKCKAQYIPLDLTPNLNSPSIVVPSATTEKFDSDKGDNDLLAEVVRSISSQSMILSAIECRQLNENLPVRLASKSWSLLYSTAVHGRSLTCFYRKAESLSKDRSVILLIRDTLGGVFGAFCPVPWVQSSTHIGNGETFVFTLRPKIAMFPWTRNNAFFVVGQKRYIAVGGGSRFALWLDESFEKGSSGTSETFHNPVLSTTPSFDCCLMELWAIS